MERKIMGKKLSKCIATFDYVDKTLIVLSAISGRISITSVIGVPVGIASASFSLVLGIIKKWLSVTRNKKKKHNRICILAKSKLNSIETLISPALINLEISHEEFKAIVNEKESMKKWKNDEK